MLAVPVPPTFLPDTTLPLGTWIDNDLDTVPTRPQDVTTHLRVDCAPCED